MILAIDIGNTTTNFGVFDKKKLTSQFAIATQPNRTPAKRRAGRGAKSRAKRGNEIALELKKLIAIHHVDLKAVEQITLCSVVPRMSGVLTEALRSLRDVPIRIVGQDLKVPLKNRYTYPEQVGHDRLVGAFAAWKSFKKSCIVVDFGTAITIDVVNKQGEYLGGIIAPGLEISSEALATRTALLPKVELKEPPELLGRDTVNSIRSGLIYGCAALCDGLVTQLKRRYAPDAVVVATGGASALVTKHTRTIDHIRPNLVLDGLVNL